MEGVRVFVVDYTRLREVAATALEQERFGLDEAYAHDDDFVDWPTYPHIEEAIEVDGHESRIAVDLGYRLNRHTQDGTVITYLVDCDSVVSDRTSNETVGILSNVQASYELLYVWVLLSEKGSVRGVFTKRAAALAAQEREPNSTVECCPLKL